MDDFDFDQDIQTFASSDSNNNNQVVRPTSTTAKYVEQNQTNIRSMVSIEMILKSKIEPNNRFILENGSVIHNFQTHGYCQSVKKEGTTAKFTLLSSINMSNSLSCIVNNMDGKFSWLENGNHVQIFASIRYNNNSTSGNKGHVLNVQSGRRIPSLLEADILTKDILMNSLTQALPENPQIASLRFFEHSDRQKTASLYRPFQFLTNQIDPINTLYQIQLPCRIDDFFPQLKTMKVTTPFLVNNNNSDTMSRIDVSLASSNDGQLQLIKNNIFCVLIGTFDGNENEFSADFIVRYTEGPGDLLSKVLQQRKQINNYQTLLKNM
jgi:hypothetical protein